MLYSSDEAVLTGLDSNVPCDTAEEFLAHLSPQHRRSEWVNGEFNWIYRGERSERFIGLLFYAERCLERGQPDAASEAVEDAMRRCVAALDSLRSSM